MMKKTLLTVAFVSLIGLMTACTESAYTPPPIGQQTFNPNQFPANNPNMLPNPQFPNQQFPNQILPGQPIPNQPISNQPLPNPAQFQFQLSSYAYLTRNQSCLPMVVSRQTAPCDTAANPTPCVVRYVKKRVKVKSCDCYVERIVAVTSAESETVTTVATERKAVEFRLDESHTSEPNQKTTDVQTDVDANVKYISPVATRKRGELPLPVTHEYRIEGQDARAIFERLAIEKDRKKDNLRRGPNIECEMDNSILGKDYYSCRFTIQLQEKDGIKMGELLMKSNPGSVGQAKTDLKSQYPAKANDMNSVFIKGNADPIALVFLTNITDEADPLNPANILLEMPGEATEGYIDEAQTIRANIKASSSLKCYTTLNQDKNVTKCMIKLDVLQGKAVENTI